MARVHFSAYLCLYVLIVCAYLLMDGRAKQIGRKNLSDEPHFKDGKHNLEYDHEAFLGKGEKRTFDQLPPEAAKEKLGKIVDKIDKDHDGKVSDQELAQWLQAANRKYYEDDGVSHWGHMQRLLLDLHRDKKGYKHDTKAPLSWEEYWKVTRHEPDPNDLVKTKEYNELMKKNKRRWEYADVDKDGKLCLDEYVSFQHPHEYGHLKALVAEEELDATDTDKDGLISKTEFVNGLVSEEERKAHKDEPEYLKPWEMDFENRDKDKSGKMDKDEIIEWLFPTSYDPWQAEAVHFISRADKDEVKECDKFMRKMLFS